MHMNMDMNYLYCMNYHHLYCANHEPATNSP